MPVPPEKPKPNLLSMGFGWEDTSNQRDWKAVMQSLSADGFNAADLAVGRPEWSLVPAEGDRTWRSSNPDVSIADAVTDVRSGGAERVYLTVDCMMDYYLTDHPEWQSVSRDGTPRQALPSAAAWTNEMPGQAMEDYIRHIADTYRGQIDGIVLTNLHWDEGSFSEADLELFKAMTGNADWTRRDDGTPHLGRPEREWLGSVMQSNVSRWQAAAGDVPVVVDVLVDWENPTVGNLSSGQDYAKLVDVADGGLSLLSYFKDEAPDQVGSLRESVETWKSGPVRLSLSLIGRDEKAISSASLGKALELLKGYPDLQVTPYSAYKGIG